MFCLFKSSIFKNVYQKVVFKRCDDTGVARYFTAEDFVSLHAEPYEFRSANGDKMQGCFYYYDNPASDKIVIFDHGMGGGHLSYMKEIEMLARRGYKVFSYDHTGCMQSGGDSCVGFAQSLSDLNACLKTLKSDSNYKNSKFAVMGHSWGGYAALNISAFHPDLTHVIVLSGFISVSAIAESFGAFKKYIYAVEKSVNPEYVDCNAGESLNNTKAKVLLIYSDNDPLVKKEKHFDVLKKSLSDRKNTEFVLEANKGHNPNYTADAVSYLGEYVSLLKKNKKTLKTDERKKYFVNSFDWDRMTDQDEKVWQKILSTLEV